eukprot:1968433-Prymnesium_polylepis.2
MLPPCVVASARCGSHAGSQHRRAAVQGRVASPTKVQSRPAASLQAFICTSVTRPRGCGAPDRRQTIGAEL